MNEAIFRAGLCTVCGKPREECHQTTQTAEVVLEGIAWRAYSKAWTEAMCWYEFYHDDELAAARERATAIARGLRTE